jgi:hypothetical protein
MARLSQTPVSDLDLLSVEPSGADLSAYPHVFRPIEAQRFGFWQYQKQGVAGWTYEGDLWSFVVPIGKVAVINRFGCWATVNSNYTIYLDAMPDPVVQDVGEYTFAIVGGTPGAATLTYKNFLWDVADYLATRPIRASFLMDPIVVKENVTVRMYAKTRILNGEMAAGVAGYFYDGVYGSEGR